MEHGSLGQKGGLGGTQHGHIRRREMGRSMVTKPPVLPRLSGTLVHRSRAPALQWPVLPGCCSQDTQISHGGWVLVSSTDTVKAPGSLRSVEL